MDGNQQRMREALENIARYAETARCHTDDVHILSFLGEIEGWARSALSAPARQCDVGTAEEQANRFGKLCGKFYNEEEPCNEKCPLASLPIIHGFPRCQAYWAQTPYAEEGGAE